MLTVPKLNHELSLTIDHGKGPLNEADVVKLGRIYGLNSVNTRHRRHWYRLLLSSLLHPFNLLLLLLAVTAGISGDYETFGILVIMVLVSSVLRFHQEFKSERAVESLLPFLVNKVTVLRHDSNLGKDTERLLPATELVPGDWLRLCAGDVIPADVEVIRDKGFYVSQAALTGEALPVRKYNRNRRPSWKCPTDTVLSADSSASIFKKTKNHFSVAQLWHKIKTRVYTIFGLVPPLDFQENSNSEIDTTLRGVNFTDMDRVDVCFMGGAVVSGKATCRVVNTGPRTVFGKLSHELGRQKTPNAFQLGVRRVSWLFFGFTCVCVPIVLVLQGCLQGDWFMAFTFAMAVAVGITPEMLPMIVNTTLAKGSFEMSKKRCIVKQLDAIIVMGEVDVLCTDKTGTLTEGAVSLNKYLSGTGEECQLTLELGYLNAHFQTFHENPLDIAITDYCKAYIGNGVQEIQKDFTFLEEIPFDFERRRLSVVLSAGERKLVVCKGAVDEILRVCTHISQSNNLIEFIDAVNQYQIAEPLSSEAKVNLSKLYEDLSADGLRVLAVAYKIVSYSKTEFGVEDEKDLTFVGFLAFLDPPKESTRQALQNLVDYNVAIKVLTGDNPLVCKKICTEIGLEATKIITGPEIAATLDSEKGDPKMDRMIDIAINHNIFAKLTPTQKSDIVKALRANGHVVGFMGDGINDAPAIYEADVGISVDTGVDICKDSADIILLEKDLTVTVDAVITGRETYGNTLKYLVMGILVNFGQILSILVASAWLPFEPMTSLQVLVQNIFYDTSQLAIPWDKMDAEFVREPRTWSIRKMMRFVGWMGPWISLFDIATFLFCFYYFGVQSSEDEGKVRLFQGSWFCVGMITQTLFIHFMRTPKLPFIQSIASWQMIVITLVLMVIGNVLPYIPALNHVLEMDPLRWEIYPFMAVLTVAYCIAVTLAKFVYLKIFKVWY